MTGERQGLPENGEYAEKHDKLRGNGEVQVHYIMRFIGHAINTCPCRRLESSTHWPNNLKRFHDKKSDIRIPHGSFSSWDVR